MKSNKLAIVPFNIAKDLKELGFNWGVLGAYNSQGVYWPSGYTNNKELEFGYAAPEQALVALWLRNVHNVHIQPNYTVFDDSKYEHYVGYRLNIIIGEKGEFKAYNLILNDDELNLKYNGGIMQGHGIVFASYEEAELEGIKECIKYLKNEI